MKELLIDKWSLIAMKASLDAGNAIMGHYNTSYTIEYKDDNSPLTTADKHAHQCIQDYLVTTGLPILSEEGKNIPFRERKDWKLFWMVDPLDGTKEFISGNGEFTVNIALIENNYPVMGVVYVPVTGQLYWGSCLHGSWRSTTKQHDLSLVSDLAEFMILAEKLPQKVNRNVVIMGSRSHQSPENKQLIDSIAQNISNVELLNAGSSLKFCRLAEGAADIYPRLGPTMEWDTAAGHAVAKFAGIRVLDYSTRNELQYNKLVLLNPFFVAVHPEFEHFIE